MTGWVALGAFYVLAVSIAVGVMVWAGRAQAVRPATRSVIPAMFPWLDERRTYANAVSIVRYALGAPAAWMIVVFAAAPTTAAVLVSFAGDGAASTGELLATLSPVNDAPVGGALVTYGVIVAAFVVVAIAYLRVARALPSAEQPAVMRGRSAAQLWPRLLGGMFVDEGGSLEELGWRGFALPVLVAAGTSSWVATGVVAVAWWAWHLPREVPGLLRRPDWAKFVRLQSQFLALCLGLSIVMTAARWHTGSVWPAVMVHGGTNVWSKAIGAPMWARTGRDVRTYVVLGAAAAVVVVALVT